MALNANLSRLIRGIVSYITDHGGFVTKTKLLKLLYVFDVEYYRLHRQTFSGFEWKFFHLGPWSKEFDPLLDALLAQEEVAATASSNPDFETKFFRTPEPADIEGIFDSFKDEAILKRILDIWGQTSTGELLDYVYFRTAPMEHGVRNELLDFNTISAEPVTTYKRSVSGKTKAAIEAARRKFHSEHLPAQHSATAQIPITPPKYDAEFFEALSKLDSIEP